MVATIDIDALKFTNKRGKKLRSASLNSKFTDSCKNKCKLTELINGSYSQTGVRKAIFRDCYVSLTIIFKKIACKVSLKILLQVDYYQK